MLLKGSTLFLIDRGLDPHGSMNVNSTFHYRSPGLFSVNHLGGACDGRGNNPGILGQGKWGGFSIVSPAQRGLGPSCFSEKGPMHLPPSLEGDLWIQHQVAWLSPSMAHLKDMVNQTAIIINVTRRYSGAKHW